MLLCMSTEQKKSELLFTMVCVYFLCGYGFLTNNNNNNNMFWQTDLT
jgi:hypothetical protein